MSLALGQSSKYRNICMGRCIMWLHQGLRLCIYSSPPGQNGRHFADDSFKRIFLNENIRISIEISLKFVPMGPINNIPALVQIMAWRLIGDKPFSYIPSSAIRRSGSARYFSVRHYRIAEKFHNNDADSSLQSMFTFSRPITALLTGALAVQGHGQVTWPDTSICSFIG